MERALRYLRVGRRGFCSRVGKTRRRVKAQNSAESTVCQVHAMLDCNQVKVVSFAKSLGLASTCCVSLISDIA